MKLKETSDVNEKYHILFEKMDEGYCEIEMIYDSKRNPVDYRFLEINPAFMKQTGLTDALTKTMREMVPNHDAHWFKIYGDVARTGKSIRFENPAAAMHRYYDVFAYRIGGEGSKRVGILFKDITKTKELEKAKQVFLSMVSHELRTPLTPIKSQLQFILERKVPKKTQKESLHIVLNNIDRLNSIINDLLDVTRMEAGRFIITKKNESLEKTIKDVVRVENQAGRKNKVKIIAEVEKLPLLSIDKDRITQVLINLINNSIKHSEAKNITVKAKKTSTAVEIIIMDDGKGMEKHDTDRLFTPFFATQTATSSGGAGLGIYICKGIIEQHDGKISAESNLGKGTRFIITLPMTRRRKNEK